MIAIITTMLSIGFLCWDIWQLATVRKNKEQKNSQVKIWHQEANGISQSLFKVYQDAENGKYSSVKDLSSTISAIQMNAQSLYQSLYEERVFDEETYKKEAMQTHEKVKETFNKQYFTPKKN